MRPERAVQWGAAGAAIVMALSVGGCQSKARQDSYKQVGSVCSFMAPTVSGTRNYTPASEKEAPDSRIAYADPETPIYCDRPISESVSAAIELANYAQALHVSGYFAVLQQKGPYTVFAIPNEPLAKYSAQFQNGLLDPANRASLKALISYTIVPGKWPVKKIKDLLAKSSTHAFNLNTLAGIPLTFSLDPATGQPLVSNAAGASNHLWVTGVPQSNGVLYFTQSTLAPVFPPQPVVNPAAPKGIVAAPLPATH
ncbi:MAG: fasciclin domain-containing protein [Acetobacter sp.]|uniref:fasciclin domain-containing protein n=1 Tax=Acetobacter sp. TaxID=440 RepID=UPI0039EC43D6